MPVYFVVVLWVENKMKLGKFNKPGNLKVWATMNRETKTLITTREGKSTVDPGRYTYKDKFGQGPILTDIIHRPRDRFWAPIGIGPGVLRNQHR